MNVPNFPSNIAPRRGAVPGASPSSRSSSSSSSSSSPPPLEAPAAYDDFIDRRDASAPTGPPRTFDFPLWSRCCQASPCRRPWTTLASGISDAEYLMCAALCSSFLPPPVPATSASDPPTEAVGLSPASSLQVSPDPRSARSLLSVGSRDSLPPALAGGSEALLMHPRSNRSLLTLESHDASSTEPTSEAAPLHVPVSQVMDVFLQVLMALSSETTDTPHHHYSGAPLGSHACSRVEVQEKRQQRSHTSPPLRASTPGVTSWAGSPSVEAPVPVPVVQLPDVLGSNPDVESTLVRHLTSLWTIHRGRGGVPEPVRYFYHHVWGHAGGRPGSGSANNSPGTLNGPTAGPPLYHDPSVCSEDETSVLRRVAAARSTTSADAARMDKQRRLCGGLAPLVVWVGMRWIQEPTSTAPLSPPNLVSHEPSSIGDLHRRIASGLLPDCLIPAAHHPTADTTMPSQAATYLPWFRRLPWWPAVPSDFSHHSRWIIERRQHRSQVTVATLPYTAVLLGQQALVRSLLDGYFTVMAADVIGLIEHTKRMAALKEEQNRHDRLLMEQAAELRVLQRVAPVETALSIRNQNAVGPKPSSSSAAASSTVDRLGSGAATPNVIWIGDQYLLQSTFECLTPVVSAGEAACLTVYPNGPDDDKERRDIMAAHWVVDTSPPRRDGGTSHCGSTPQCRIASSVLSFLQALNVPRPPVDAGVSGPYYLGPCFIFDEHKAALSASETDGSHATLDSPPQNRAWPPTVRQSTAFPLVLCCGLSGDAEMLRTLVEEYCIDPWTADPFGWTVAHFAASRGHLHVLEYLVQRLEATFIQTRSTGPTGAAPATSSRGETRAASPSPSSKNDDAKIAASTFLLSLSTAARWTVEHLAAASNHLHLMDYFHRALHATFRSVDVQGQTPLHVACMHGQTECVEYLATVVSGSTAVSNGLLNIVDTGGLRAIDVAAMYRQRSIVLRLAALGSPYGASSRRILQSAGIASPPQPGST